ncbi:MAG: hypothetical protein RMK20_06440 [Verrucomicrobiales bacterium]|nr:hypothetical protein [Verrucomicrobiales bacterium]
MLVPAPREVRWFDAPPAKITAESVAIVLGAQATEPEQEAARLLREYVAKRFRQQWPVVREGAETPAHKTLIVLGQRSTCRLLDTLCARHNVNLSPTAPGHDGYVIQPLAEGGRLLVLVGGCNARAVQYAQDTFAQMLRRAGDAVEFVQAAVRDAPVIPWRGRPQTEVKHYLRPGELDLYVLSRVNFIDLRSGIYAFEPGETLDHAEITRAIRGAHRRGILVYATVNCGVPGSEYDKVLKTFRELLDLGADGLWLSFDDRGPGDDPVALAKRVLELGRERNIRGHLVAITPPKGSYQRVVTEFNRKLMAVPGMEQAIWFWTPVPSPEMLAQARSLGLKTKPGWWHNWPRYFTAQAYWGVPPLADGWSAPDYELLAAGGECLEAVMPWGGNALGQHYVVPVINWWGWNPRGHDWRALRARIYSIVFGESQVDAAMRFDDRLRELFGLFRYAYKSTEHTPFCPPRLKNATDRPAAHALLREMTAALETLAQSAPNETLLPREELQSAYLERMRRELDTHRAAADLAYPEEWWPDYQRKILDALHAGNEARVNELAAAARPRVLKEIEQITRALAGYPHLASYAAWWRKRASLDAGGWKQVLEARQQTLRERVTNYSHTILSDATMTDWLRNPPIEWGIGRWQVANRLLATVLPAAQEQFWGDWIAGRHRTKNVEAAVFTADRVLRPGEPGEYVELPATVPVSGKRDRLGLLIFVSAANKDLFSNTLVHYRWAGYRFLQLRWDERVLWEADLGQIPERGQWFMVRLPRIPDDVPELHLRIRAEDRKLSMNNYTIAYFGPIRLMELPE